MSVYVFIFNGEIVSKIVARTQFDAEWEFRKRNPFLRDKDFEIVVKGRVRTIIR